MASYVKDQISKSGNVFKNMVGEIVRECQSKNIELSANVIAYSVILYFIDPNCGVKDMNNITRSDIDIFVENCVSRLSDMNSPYIKSFQLQFICLEIPSTTKMLNESDLFEGKVIPDKAAKLIKDITEVNLNDPEIEETFKKIVFDIIISNRIGKPSDPQTVIEVTNALRSVLTANEFHEFMMMQKHKRLKRLKKLRLIVCGIMIFNHTEGEVGENMRDIIKDVVTVYKKIKNSILDSCDSSAKNLRRFQQARKNVFRVNVENNEVNFLHKNIAEVEQLRGVMQLYVQYGIYLNKLLNITLKQRKSMNELIEQWHDIITKIRKIVIYRIPITTDVIFPHFIELSIIWHNLWEYLRIMINIKSLLDEMSAIFVIDNLLDITAVFDYALKTKIDDNKQIKHIKKAPFKFPADCEWIDCEPQSDFSKNLSTVHGFCAYLLILCDGMLMPSNLNIGILKYNNRYYTFSDIKYFKPFTDNPQKFEDNFMRVIRCKPHLIVFFDMYDTIRNYKFINIDDRNTIRDIESQEKTKSIQIQTELHPIPFYKDTHYTWNVWDLRRKAVQLANIKHCQTHSSQTDTTYYRYSTKLQTVLLKLDEVQTKKDTSIDTQTDF